LPVSLATVSVEVALQGHAELMLLDDQFMLAAFYAEYAATSGPQDLENREAFRFWSSTHARPPTGLM